MKKRIDEDLKMSNEVRFHKLEDGLYIGWNRFFPKILRFNDEAIQFLKNIQNSKNNQHIFEENPEFKNQLLKFKFIHTGSTNGIKNEFLKSINHEYERIQKNVDNFYNNSQDYVRIYIYNDCCNLDCSYCIQKYKKYKYNNTKNKLSIKKKLEIINSVIDQYISLKFKNNVWKIPICFNGGEILLEWDLVKEILIRNQKKYPDIKFKYYLNTNMTLLTEEISAFLSKFDFQVDISIDGYSSAHNRSRVYHDGRGSFGDVIKGLEIFRKFNNKSSINNFQGTIENPDQFNPDEVLQMKKYGFERARLEPNLLNETEEKVKKKIKIMENLFNLNLTDNFKINDSYYDTIRQLLSTDKYNFRLPCSGLSCTPRMTVYINISNLKICQVCSYISRASIKLETINNDIYHRKLWEVSKNFIHKRLNAIKKYCIDCDIVGICRGSCIMSGLDIDNQLNKAACLYQQEMWKVFLNYMYKNELKVDEIN